MVVSHLIWVLELNSGPLGEYRVFLTMEFSLQVLFQIPYTTYPEMATPPVDWPLLHQSLIKKMPTHLQTGHLVEAFA